MRGWANLVLTNPDMLHAGILPGHGAWAETLHRLRYVVVDEAHVYRGVFGSHVANVLARLRRMCEHYGARPAFVLASATSPTPAQAGSTLAGGPVAVIEDDGSPAAERDIVVWNPPLLDAERRHPGQHAGRSRDPAGRDGRRGGSGRSSSSARGKRLRAGATGTPAKG